MKIVNLETITGAVVVQDGCNRIHVKQNLVRKQKRVYGSSWSRQITNSSMEVNLETDIHTPCRGTYKI